MSSPRDAGRPDGRTLGRRVTAAAAWMVAFRWIDRLIGLASIAFLARLLSPADFGIVGYAMLVIGLLELFTGISTDAELIRHKLADRDYYNAAWTMNIMRGVAIGVLMLALAQPAVMFFGEPRLVPIMLALAAIPLVQGFENVGIVEFRKNLEFDREFRFLLVTRLLGTLATVVLAIALRSYWALVAGTILRTVFRVAMSYQVHPFRPGFNIARVPEIFRFSRWMMLQNLAAGVYDKLPGFVIGRQWDSSTLAFFNAGKELAELSASEVRAPIRRALYPGLAQLADRRERLGEVLVESTGMLALLTLPIPLGIALVAEDLVPLILGAQWHPTVALLQPLCIAASIAAIGTNSQLAYMALNRSHLVGIAAFLRVLFLFALLVAITPAYGVVGVAYAIAGASTVVVIADYVVSSRMLKINAGRFLAAVWRPVLASLVMCVAVWLFRAEFAPPATLPGHAWLLAGASLLGGIVYAACVLALWAIAGRGNGAERRLVTLVANYRRHRRARPAE